MHLDDVDRTHALIHSERMFESHTISVIADEGVYTGVNLLPNSDGSATDSPIVYNEPVRRRVHAIGRGSQYPIRDETALMHKASLQNCRHRFDLRQ